MRRRSVRHRSGLLTGIRARQVLKLAVVPLWLPVATLVVSIVGFGRHPTVLRLVMSPLGEDRLPRAGEAVQVAQDVIPNAGLAIVALFACGWLGALPLTVGVYRLHSRSRRLAYVCAGVLAPLTVAAVFGALHSARHMLFVVAPLFFVSQLPHEIASSEPGRFVINLPGKLFHPPPDAPGLVHFGRHYILEALPIALPAWVILAALVSLQRNRSAPARFSDGHSIARLAVASCWLPIVTLIVIFAGVVTAIFEVPHIAWFLLSVVVPTWIAALPLSLSVYLLYRHSRALGVACATGLGLVTLFLVPIASVGGPLSMASFGIACSLPAWIILGLILYRQRQRISATSGST